MTDSNKKTKINLINIKLIEFGIQIITFLVDSIHKTCCKQAINNITKYSDNNLIMLLIMNIQAQSVTYIKESLTICHCQMDKLDHPKIGNIDDVSKKIVLLWQEIICHSGQPAEVDINIDYT